MQSCIDQFSEAFPEVAIEYDVFRHHKQMLVKRFEGKHCICKGKSTGRQTVLSENVVADVQVRIERSPKKSLSQLAVQTGMIQSNTILLPN